MTEQLRSTSRRRYLLSIHSPAEPVAIFKGTTPLTRQQTSDELLADGAKRGWSFDKTNRIVWIKPMAGWYYAVDERKAGDPEKDSVHWLESAQPEEKFYDLRIQLAL